MSQHTLFMALLRPPILHILRAAGFHAARPAAVDSMVDLAARYLLLISSKTAEMAQVTHNGGEPTITDARLALEHVGALRPQVQDAENQLYEEDDIRGITSFVKWFSSDTNKEIGRIAGLLASADLAEVEAGLEREDFLAVLKKKHSKTGEESRFQGTMLGKDFEERQVTIDGGLDTIQEWETQRRQASQVSDMGSDRLSSAPLSTISSPISDLGS